MSREDMQTEGQILKLDEEQRMFYGWASVVTEKGIPVVDRQGDIIEPETLEKAATQFMKDYRVGKVMHCGEQKVTFIHSLPLTKQLADVLGIQIDREGWIVGGYVHDDDTWNMVKSGKLPALSIGGRARREKVDG